MTSKYIDLTDRIEEGAEYSNTTSFCLGIECALRWLDEHPDQVPGRTMTRSDMVEAFGEEYAEWATSRLARIGYTIVPDPEPTNAEKYTPDEAELIGCYAGAMEEQAGENYDKAQADAMRGIAKIKADALREAADGIQAMDSRATLRGIATSIRVEADRIEEDA